MKETEPESNRYLDLPDTLHISSHSSHQHLAELFHLWPWTPPPAPALPPSTPAASINVLKLRKGKLIFQVLILYNFKKQLTVLSISFVKCIANRKFIFLPATCGEEPKKILQSENHFLKKEQEIATQEDIAIQGFFKTWLLPRVLQACVFQTSLGCKTVKVRFQTNMLILIKQIVVKSTFLEYRNFPTCHLGRR